MASIRFELQHRKNRNKKYPVRMVVRVGGKRVTRGTGVEVDRLKDFNKDTKGFQWIRPNVLNYSVLNERLRVLKLEAEQEFDSQAKRGPVTATALISSLNKENVSHSFIDFSESRANEIEQAGGYRNSLKYHDLLNKLKEFAKKSRKNDIMMEELTPELLMKFKNFLHNWENKNDSQRRLHPNTIEVQFTVFKALVKHAILIGLIQEKDNPFSKFDKASFKGITTTKEKLDKDEMQRIINLDLEPGTLIWHVRNCFMFSFYQAGIRVSDLIQLRWCCISSDNRIDYAMHKNSKKQDLVLAPQALAILEHYRKSDCKPTDYIFPFLENEAIYASFVTFDDRKTMSPELQKMLQRRVEAKTALINKYLKQIAAKASIHKKLSSHIARHSFANIAKQMRVDTRIVQQLLQHSRLTTTEIYMGNFENKESDEAILMIGDATISKNIEDTVPNELEGIIDSVKNMSKDDRRTLLNALLD